MNKKTNNITCIILIKVQWWYLETGTYAIVITSRKEVGSFLGFPVYRLMSMRVLACNQALKFSTSQEVRGYIIISYWVINQVLYVWFILNMFSVFYFSIEKGWSVLFDTVKNSGVNAGFILFLWNRYYIKVSVSVLKLLVYYYLRPLIFISLQELCSWDVIRLVDQLAEKK